MPKKMSDFINDREDDEIIIDPVYPHVTTLADLPPGLDPALEATICELMRNDKGQRSAS